MIRIGKPGKVDTPFAQSKQSSTIRSPEPQASGNTKADFNNSRVASHPMAGISRLYPAKKSDEKDDVSKSSNRFGSSSVKTNEREETELKQPWPQSSFSRCQSTINGKIVHNDDHNSKGVSGKCPSNQDDSLKNKNPEVNFDQRSNRFNSGHDGKNKTTKADESNVEEVQFAGVKKIREMFNDTAKRDDVIIKSFLPCGPSKKEGVISNQINQKHDPIGSGSIDGEGDLADSEWSSCVNSEDSTPTSGYATDHSAEYPTDRIRHTERRTTGYHDEKFFPSLTTKSNTIVTEFEPSLKTDCSGGPPIRTFEVPTDEPEHPYFSRIAAEAEEPTPILSRSGSFRGVKNLVRSGVTTFLHKQKGKATAITNYNLVEKGKVVFYTTSMSVVRETSEKCQKTKKILQNQMVEFDERDVFISKLFNQELAERLENPDVELPQVFIDGIHLGGCNEIERLNENGTLRKIFNHFKKVQQPGVCVQCGGYRFVPCGVCHGSKKSRRNCFTDEFCALRCTFCDDNGLVKCNTCNSNNSHRSNDETVFSNDNQT